jgi:uncharacterized membrane protein
MDYDGWMGGSGLGMLVWVLVWVSLIVLVVWGTTSLFGRRTGDAQTDALEILKRRFATGEITAAEFETARRALA